MKVLVLGTGAREHALAWKIRQSPMVTKTMLHPGNAGTHRDGFAPLDNRAPLLPQILEGAFDLVVIGPEGYLADGLSDTLRTHSIPTFGPGKLAARLETSKRYAKEFMQRAAIPTAAFMLLETESALQKFAEDRHTYPVVLKYDGLAAGKGVVVAERREDILAFSERVFTTQEFGKGPHCIVAEEFIRGDELSFIGLCDTNTFTPLSSSTDYKRVFDGQTGPNTGGMGAISPSPFESPELIQKIELRIVKPLLAQLKKESLDYRGALYIGVMIDQNRDPQVLEFNARFGDPETQALLIRLESDIVPALLATSQATLASVPPLSWRPGASAYVVAAAGGYPEKPVLGDPITGLEVAQKMAGVHIFFSGVAARGSEVVTSGGRVLGVGAVGSALEKAREAVYRALPCIHFRAMHFRKDIGV